MRDILPDLIRWQKEKIPIALATVVQTWGSSPRNAGSKMAVTLAGKMTGSVSGGCVENAVAEAGMQSLKTNRPQLLHFGVADETAWEVGLACGGSIDIFVQPLESDFINKLHSIFSDEIPFVHAFIIRGPDDLLGHEMLIAEDGIIFGSIGNQWDNAVLTVGMQAISLGFSRRMSLSETVEVFFDVVSPPPTLIMVGGVHIAIALAALAKTLGFRTILIDPRKAWGSEERFPHVDMLIQDWVDDAFTKIRITRSTAIAMLTHDPKLDDPALKIALTSPAFYVGALGSKATNAKRRERLLNDGLSESELSRLHAPIGLEIGASTPQEIALSIMSEVVKTHRKPNRLEGKEEATHIQSLVSDL